MNNLINTLRSFNSKERFFLIGHVLGNASFTLSEKFKEKIETKLHLQFPDNSFTAIDYHLDWLYASLYSTFNNGRGSQIFSNSHRIIKAQQEDVDLIIAFQKDGSYHIILLEAKGVTGWTNKQMTSKANRFREIFGTDGKKWPNVIPHFLLMSPKQSKHLNISEWPTWMSVNGQAAWIELPIPNGLRKVTRCDEAGSDDKNGGFWKVSVR